MGTIYSIYADASDWSATPGYPDWASCHANSVTGRQNVLLASTSVALNLGLTYDSGAQYPFIQRQSFFEFQVGSLPRAYYFADLFLTTRSAPSDDFVTNYDVVRKDWISVNIPSMVNSTTGFGLPVLARGRVNTNGVNQLSRTANKTTISPGESVLSLIVFPERLRGAAPTGAAQTSFADIHSADASGTTNDPYIQLEIFLLQEFITTPGSGTFTVPSGVTSLGVEAWGAGGGGGGNTAQEPGGGGGAFVQDTLSVTPGQQISYSIGAGGAVNNAGGDTWVVNSSTYLAKGGGGGNGATAGAAGSAVNSIGPIKFAGGAGGAQQGGGGSRGGSGGGAAGSSEGAGAAGAVGSSATGGSGGVGVAGAGSGGDGGHASSGTATEGSAPGGGGGGKSTLAAAVSMAGAAGGVRFTYNEVLAPGGGGLKYWNGSAWVVKPMKRWNGSTWVAATLKRWNGSTWVTVP